VRIWDAETGKDILVISGHSATEFVGDWSPDGSRVATISIDDTMRIWDSKSGAELLNLSAPTEYYGNVRWSPDGKYIALGLDGAGARLIRAWQSTAELMAYAKACCVFRGLSEAERTQFGLR
jgi:WD40 repeat protein